MGLFTPAWMKDNDYQKALNAIKNETNQAKLVIAANDAPISDVRIAAIVKLTDLTVITNIAKNDGNKDVRVAAINKLTDQDVLADIAKNGNSYDVYKAAISKLKNKNMLFNLITNGDYAVRELALDNLFEQGDISSITDEQILMLFAYRATKNPNYIGVAEQVISKINDPQKLTRFVCDCIGYYETIQRYSSNIINIFLSAMARISDEELLYEVATKAHEYFGVFAVQKINDKSKLESLTKHIKTHSFVSQGGPGEEDGSFQYDAVSKAAIKRLAELT